jgi:hypothetical protein
VLVLVLVVTVASVGVASVGDDGDDGDDAPSVSLGVLVFAFVAVFIVASVPSRTISKGRGRETKGKG